MAKLDDLTGKRFGRLVVLEFGGYSDAKKKNTKWVCRCDCGNIVTRTRKALLNSINSGCDKCRHMRKDLTGKRFGRLTVQGEAYRKNNTIYWECKCDCGNTTYLPTSSLTVGHTISCGCAKKKIDLTGKRFGRWTVLGRSKHNSRCWRCRCDCGTEKDVYQSALIYGKSVSCGCYHHDMLSKRLETHGMSNSRIYNIYHNIKNRCGNPNNNRYKDYGGRGIKMCDEWSRSFEAFYDWAIKNGYRDDLSIDRIDNDGDYTPENCKWSTIEQQSNNKRRTVFFEFLGVKKSLKQWTDFMGWSYEKHFARRRRGKDTFRQEEIEQIIEKLKKEGVLCPANQSVPCAENCESPRTWPSPGEILS